MTIDDGTAGFTSDDLNLVGGDPAGETGGGGEEADETAGGGTTEKAGETDKAAPEPAGKAAPDNKGEADADGKATLAAGGKAEAAKEPEGYWPKDWREKVAEHIAAGDKKTYDKELRRLQRITDPAGVYGNYRELDNRLNGGGLIKIPGKDAKPEEIAEYHKSLGVPEKPEGYLEQIELQNGAVIGEADKPMVDAVLSAIHQAGAPPAVASAMLNWYYAEQEKQAAELDEFDDAFKRESQAALKEEWGPAYQRHMNAIEPLFATAEGGTDLDNSESLFARLLGGRMSDNSVIGNDPAMLRWLASLSMEINPAMTVVEDGDQSGKTIAGELEEIRKLQQSNNPADKKKYWSDAVQARELELIAAQQKLQAKA